MESKIYKLCNEETGDIYIGSTSRTLAHRKSQHKYDYKRWLNNKGNYVSSFKLYEKPGNIKIELIESMTCEDKRILRQKEKEHIQFFNTCVNKYYKH